MTLAVAAGCSDSSGPAPGRIATLTISPPSPAVAVGRSIQLFATIRDATGALVSDTPVSWSTSNPAVAIVSQEGLVTGLAAGTTVTITAKSEGVGSSTILRVVNAVATGLNNVDEFVDSCPDA